MNEKIFASLVGRNEAIALLVTEPLHFSTDPLAHFSISLRPNNCKTLITQISLKMKWVLYIYIYIIEKLGNGKTAPSSVNDVIFHLRFCGVRFFDSDRPILNDAGGFRRDLTARDLPLLFFGTEHFTVGFATEV